MTYKTVTATAAILSFFNGVLFLLAPVFSLSLLGRDGQAHLSEIGNTLHIEHGAVLIKYVERGDFQVIAQDGDIKHFPTGFRADHPIVTWMSRENQPLLNWDLSLVPIFKSMWKREMEELERFNGEIFIPLNSKGELIGILALGKNCPPNHIHRMNN
jgi:GAF domain-containing protein